MLKNNRNTTIDFWRGIVLMVIVVNHIPGNFLENLTPRNFGFSDATEAFVFISGLSVALAYYPTIPKYNMASIIMRCLRRSFLLYRTHLMLTAFAVVLFAIGYEICEDVSLLDDHGRKLVFGDTAKGITGIVFLGHQLGYFNILPLYIVLMLWAPFTLILLRYNKTLALTISIFLYILARKNILDLPSWPETGTWFLNPFAWQLLFTFGAFTGVLHLEHKILSLKPYIGVFATILIVSAFIVLGGFGFFPDLYGKLGGFLDTHKGSLGIGRCIHFLAMAGFIVTLTPKSIMNNTFLGAEIQRIGRHSLSIFVVGSLVSAVGQILAKTVSIKSSANPGIVSAIYTVLGLIFLFLVARYLERESKSVCMKESVGH